jgi:phytoene/squalene synthetase
MTSIYRELLRQIAKRDGDVFSRRIKVSPWRKMWLAAQWLPSAGRLAVR